MSERKKILFVAIHTIIHAARWIEQADGLGFECHLFPINAEPPHSRLQNVTIHVPTLSHQPSSSLNHRLGQMFRDHVAKLQRAMHMSPRTIAQQLKRRLLGRHRNAPAGKQPTAPGAAVTPLRLRPFAVDHLLAGNADSDVEVRLGRDGESDAAAPRLYGPDILAALISELKPDLIHSMEFQHAGYLVLAARDLQIATAPPWLATNWGSDIYHFGTEPGHAPQIRRLCETIDLYSCECHRDIDLARDFGYRGPHLPVLPNSGGMDVERLLALRDPSPPSARKIIMVKGYDHFAGRAMISLAILERLADRLRDYTIVMFSVGARPRARAIELAEAKVLDIRVVDWATHDDILRQFGQARLYLGISISDAISTSVLEAMVMGAFPIQTNTSCCAEWFIDGTSGFAVPVDDFEFICDRFERALNDDALVDAAAATNLDIIRSQLALPVFSSKMRDFYDTAMAHVVPTAGARP